MKHGTQQGSRLFRPGQVRRDTPAGLPAASGHPTARNER
ncbi:UNVERIFIED_CONTAM: hypothetical protein RKD50_000276 [Streptomyces canus]